MDRRSVLVGALGLAALPARALESQQPAAGAFDLARPGDALRALVKMRGDLGGAPAAWVWGGTIWSHVPGEPARKLFLYDAFSVCRFEAYKDGFRLLNRECGFYRDPVGGEILKRWRNPFLGYDVEVMHRFNEHVNAELLPGGPFAAIPTVVVGNDIWWRLEVFYLRPSPLTRAEFPLNVQSDSYQGAEIYFYHARLSELQDPATRTIAADVAWTRLGQWEPFMEMGNRPGEMVFHAAGKRLTSGPEELRQVNPPMFDLLQSRYPEYLEPPREFVPGTVSQWDAFREWQRGRDKRR